MLAPAHNEEDNIAPLVREIEAALTDYEGAFEILIIDDASTDQTAARLADLLIEHPGLRVIRFPQRPERKGFGQSAAFREGIAAARGAIIAMLDADLQNDPADIPALVEVMERTGADLVQGDRSHARRDTLVRRVSSIVGRVTRRLILGDIVRDTGCSLRLIRREVALRLPLEFRGMHRFVPITVKQMGCKVIEHPVNHRPRVAGKAKYGIWNRAIPGLIDCFAVRWMRGRRVIVEGQETERRSETRSVGRSAANTEHAAV